MSTLTLDDIAYRLDLHASGLRSERVRNLLLAGAKEAEFAEASEPGSPNRAYHLANLSAFLKAALLNMSYSGTNMDYVEPLARLLIAVEDLRVSMATPEPASLFG